MSNEKQDRFVPNCMYVRVYVCVAICTHKQNIHFPEVLEVNLNNIQDVDHTQDILNEVHGPRLHAISLNVISGLN